MDFLKSDKHPQTQEFLELNLDSDLKPTITRTTRITTKTPTRIDNTFISQRLQHKYTSNDHMPSVIKLQDQKKSKKEPLRIPTRELNSNKLNELNSKLPNMPWEFTLQNLDTEETFNCFHKQLQDSLDEVIPLKMKTISYNCILRDPWLTNSLKNCLNKQKRLYKDTLLSDSVEKISKYKTYRNTLQKAIRYCKSQYYLNKCIEYKNK